MHKQPVYLRGEVREERINNYICVTSDSSVSYVNGVSESLFKRGLCLPSGPYVSDEDVQRIVSVILNAIQR